MTAEPQDIAHSPSRNTLEITWDDGVVSVFPVPYLRGWCPCASCQGHGPDLRYREAPPSTTLQGVYEMGAYAIGARFSDGHDSGIYTWSWLRRIAPQTSPVGLKTGAFHGGTYVPRP